jgi:hypothetical protein
MTEPEAIVFGGSVGEYFDKFEQSLNHEIQNYRIPLVKLPILLKAQRPSLAVVYGCYDLSKQVFSHA